MKFPIIQHKQLCLLPVPGLFCCTLPCGLHGCKNSFHPDGPDWTLLGCQLCIGSYSWPAMLWLQKHCVQQREMTAVSQPGKGGLITYIIRRHVSPKHLLCCAVLEETSLQGVTAKRPPHFKHKPASFYFVIINADKCLNCNQPLSSCSTFVSASGTAGFWPKETYTPK